MKKRIYKINNKNLVTGNPNEVTENEILVKENNDGTVELSHRNNGTLETLGSGNGSGATIEYLAGPFEDSLFYSLQTFAYLIKIRDGNKNFIQTAIAINQESTKDNTLAFAIIPNSKVMDSDGNMLTIKDFLILLLGENVYNFLARITEEQFYDLTLPTE